MDRPTAERVAPDGTREVAHFVGPESQRIFCVTHLPADQAQAAVLVCPSMLADFIPNYRREVDLARALAARGIAAQRFHYRGLGNSDDAGPDFAFDSMLADAAAALDDLRERTSAARVAILGTRWGTLVGAALGSEHHGWPLALWEPIFSGAKFFREAFRARLMADMSASQDGDDIRPGGGSRLMQRAADEGEGGADATTLDEELERGDPVDVLGYPVGRKLYDSARELRLRGLLGDEPRPVLLVSLSRASPDRGEAARSTRAWTELGFDVDLAHLPSRESWWFLDERAVRTDELVETTGDWLQRRLAAERSR